MYSNSMDFPNNENLKDIKYPTGKRYWFSIKSKHILSRA